MAIFSPHFLYAILVLLAHKALSTPHHELRTLKFTLFQQSIVNKTAFIVVNGVAGPPLTLTTAPIGTISVYDEPLTIKSNASSKAVGTIEETLIGSTLDGLHSLYIAKITLKMEEKEGSISVMGSAHNTDPSMVPIVGGTGDFMFVQGYVITSLEGGAGIHFTFKIDFHLYWPPYASL